MSGNLEKIRESMAEYLSARGIPAAAGWPDEKRTRGKTPLVAVTVRSCQAAPSGFQNYLGQKYDGEKGVWREYYGQRLDVVLGLDIYAQEETGAADCQSTFDAMAEALRSGAPDGLNVVALRCGETCYDQNTRLYRRSAEAQCSAWLTAVTDGEGSFLDFEIRGAMH